MKPGYPRPFLLLALFSCFLQLHSQDDRYDAVYEKLVKEYTLYPDGRVDYRYMKQQKLQTYRAFHNLYGETFVVYDTLCQKLKAGSVYTLMADGKRVDAPANAFNAVLPGFAAAAPYYNNLREMVITHTGLEKNATIFLDYTVETAKGIIPFLSGNEILAESEPVKHLEIRIRVPEGTRLQYETIGTSARPAVSKESSFSVNTWTLKDVPALSAEENQPGGNATAPRLLFTTAPKPDSWGEYLSTRPGFGRELPGDAAEMVEKHRSETPDKFQLGMKLQDYVVNDMKTYPVPFRHSFYRLRSPGECWNSNGGTPAEKAALLSAMLNKAGIVSSVVAILRTATAGEKAANLLSVDDFAVKAVFPDQKTWYLSVGAMNQSSLQKTLAGRTFVPVGPDRDGKAEKSEIPENQVRVTGQFQFTSDPVMTGEISVYLGGSAYPYASMTREKMKFRSLLSGGMIKNDSINLKKNVVNLDNGYQVYTAGSDKPCKKDSSFWFFQLPAVTTGVDGWNIRTLSMKRESSYEIPSKADEGYSFTLKLPSGVTLFTPEQKVNIANKAGTFQWEVSREEDKITVRRSIRFSSNVFPVEEYPGLKELLDGWNNPWQRQLVFRQQ